MSEALADTVLARSVAFSPTVVAIVLVLSVTTPATSLVLSVASVSLSDKSLRISRPGLGANNSAAAAPSNPPIKIPFKKVLPLSTGNSVSALFITNHSSLEYWVSGWPEVLTSYINVEV
ncbi:hypothetical protein D3C85_1583490 [compost metagenome]